MNKFHAFIDQFGAARLAARLEVSKGTVSHWRSGRHKPDARRCRRIASLSEGAVSVHDIRPDIFGPRPSTPRAAA